MLGCEEWVLLVGEGVEEVGKLAVLGKESVEAGRRVQCYLVVCDIVVW